METALTNYLTSSIDHGLSSEAHTCSAIQKILHYLLNVRFHYHIRKDPVLSQMVLSHTLQYDLILVSHLCLWLQSGVHSIFIF